MATSKELLKAIDQGATIRHNGTEVTYSPRRPGDRLCWVMREGYTYYRYTAAQCDAVFPAAEVAEPVQETAEERMSRCLCPVGSFNGEHRDGCPLDVPVPVFPAAEGNFQKAVAVAIGKRNAGGDETCGCTNRGSAEGEHASDCIAGLNETAPVAVIAPSVKASITPSVIEALRTLRKATVSERVLKAIDTLDNAGIFAAIDETTGYDVAPEPKRVSKCTCVKGRFPSRFTNHMTGCPGDPAEWGDMAFTTAPVRRACPNQGCTGEFAVNRDGSLRAHTNDNCEPCGDDKRARRELLQGRINLKF